MGAVNGASSYLVPGPRPGLLQDTRTGEYLEAKIKRHQIFYDTELITTPVTAGQTYTFFVNRNFPGGAPKGPLFTNMVTEGQFPSGWHAQISKISFRPLKIELNVGAADFPTAEDMIRLIGEGFMQFTKANQRTENEGRLEMFPSPYGLNVFANGAVIPDITMVNNGVPSAAAVPGWIYPINIENQVTFDITVQFPRGIILDANTYMLSELHTTLIQPIV